MVTSGVLYLGLVLATALERLLELRVSTRHARASLARGGREHGRGHYPAMVALHAALLAGAPAEVFLLDRPFVPALGLPALAAVLLAQALRWWCVTTLGERWTTRVIALPGRARVRGGPYAFLSHPNYLAVALEGLALPLVHGAWITALAFSALNAVLLAVRIRCEDDALGAAEGEPHRLAGAAT